MGRRRGPESGVGRSSGTPRGGGASYSQAGAVGEVLDAQYE
jgi:hypothetical protein